MWEVYLQYEICMWERCDVKCKKCNVTMATYNSFHWTTWNKGNFFYVLFSDTRMDRIKVAVGSLSLLEKKWCQITARSKATQEPGKNRALYPPTFLQPPRPNQPPTPLCPNPPFRHADFSISFLLLILSYNKTTACLLTNGGGRKQVLENHMKYS